MGLGGGRGFGTCETTRRTVAAHLMESERWGTGGGGGGGIRTPHS